MKNLIITAGIAISILALLSFRIDYYGTSSPHTVSQQEDSGFSVPDDIKAIMDKSCLPCHGKKGKSGAKMKWNYEKMGGLKPSKLVGRLSKIASKVKKEKMPPAKYLKKNPEKALSDADKKALIDWANGLMDDLVK